MPTLPDFTDLGAMPSGRSERRVSTFDTTAIGEGMSSFGSGLTSAAGSLRDLWQKHEDAQAEHGSLAFLADDQARLNDLQKTNAGGEPRGSANQYLADATARVQAYVPTLPSRRRRAASLLQEVEAASPPAAREAFSLDDFRRVHVFHALQKAVPSEVLAKAVAVPDAKALADQDALAAVGAERARQTTTPGRVAFACSLR